MIKTENCSLRSQTYELLVTLAKAVSRAEALL